VNAHIHPVGRTHGRLRIGFINVASGKRVKDLRKIYA
jgi:hypothetical protein